MPFKKGQIANPRGGRAHRQKDYKEKIIFLCWRLLEKDLKNKKVALDIKRDIAKAIASKTCPTIGKYSGGDKVIIINQPKTMQPEARELRVSTHISEPSPELVTSG